MAYETPIKLTHRATVLELYRVCEERLPIVYVDDEAASATMYFLDRGVPESHLMPINYDRDACTSISRVSGIAATRMDAAKSALDVECSVLWLDLQCRKVHQSVFAQAKCTYLVLTLSTRGATADEIVESVSSQMRKSDRSVLEVARYKGKSGITNVVKIIAWSPRADPRPRRCSSSRRLASKRTLEQRTSIEKAARSLLGRSVHIPVAELPHGYTAASTKIVRGRYAFQVTGTYRRKRLILQRLLPNGRLGKEVEPWTMSVENVKQYGTVV